MWANFHPNGLQDSLLLHCILAGHVLLILVLELLMVIRFPGRLSLGNKDDLSCFVTP